jgi:hypothetical protein
MRRSAAIRALANFLMLLAGRLLPRERLPWAEAMRSEMQQVGNDFEALTWALGCFMASLRLLAREYVMKREATVSFVISFVIGAAIWALSPIVTGENEPWDADSGIYYVALAVAGLIVGWLCPHRIWPILPGLALGQFAYVLAFVPKGPLIAIGVIAMFIFGLIATAAAFLSSRLRRFWSGDDSSHPAA